MTSIPEPGDQTEAYESLDEAFDEEGLPGHGGGGGVHDAEDLVVDRTALREVGGDLDDADRIAPLDGAMDDPDGSEATVRPRRARSAGRPAGEEGAYGDPDVEFVETDPARLDEMPDDLPGPDSARW